MKMVKSTYFHILHAKLAWHPFSVFCLWQLSEASRTAFAKRRDKPAITNSQVFTNENHRK